MINEIIDNYVSQINQLQITKECYEIRLHLIKTNYATKDEYEKNEVDILKIRTLHTINKLNQEIHLVQGEFEENYGRMIEELKFQDNDIKE
jgi:hypothetical protein